MGKHLSINGSLSNMMKIFVIAVLLAITVFTNGIFAQNLTLPVYSLNLNPDFMSALDANPNSTVTYPGSIEYYGVVYSCQVRYRGGESLFLPKRSWKIFFDGNGSEGMTETNLNAEYLDYSICRNYLTFDLGNRLGLDVPDARFVSMKLNGAYIGVYVEIEQVDNDFFTSRGLGGGALFKGVNEGARFAPPVNSEDLTGYFEPQVLSEGGVDTLGARIAFIQNCEIYVVHDGLPSIIDISNFIDYFALMFCVGNEDGMVKNYYIHAGTDSRYTLVPWDCDATFGNTEEGEYENPVDRLVFDQLVNQAVFQRIISDSQYRGEFLQAINYTINFGFSGVIEALTSAFDEIRNDIYQDNLKRGSNQDFEDEYYRVLTYMLDRKQRLMNLDYFDRINIVDYSAAPDYISAPSSPILFKAKITEPAYSVSVFIYDAQMSDTSIYLADDGTSGDITAGDLEFAKLVSLNGMTPPYYYCFQVNRSQSEAYMTPPAGYFMYEDYQLSLPSVQLNTDPPQMDDIEIGNVFLSNNTKTYYFGLINKSGDDLDFSGGIVKIGYQHEYIRIPVVPELPPLDTLYISNHKGAAEGLLPGSTVVGGFYFTPSVGDTLKFETPSGELLVSKRIDDIESFGETIGAVVINEINYHSSPAFNPDDWIEIAARIGNHDLSFWSLKDSRDDHAFVIPEGTYLPEGEFLVLAKNLITFQQRFPDVDNVIGGYDFGFGGTGDDVRLFDNSNILIDWVAYTDSLPWPKAADGDGATLELKDLNLTNYSYENWDVSGTPHPHGTPGDTNTAFLRYHIDEYPPVLDSWQILSAYPNPFNSSLRISYYALKTGEVKLRVYDILGRRVSEVRHVVSAPGYWSMGWDGRDSDGKEIASGIYFLRLETNTMSEIKKVVLIR